MPRTIKGHSHEQGNSPAGGRWLGPTLTCSGHRVSELILSCLWGLLGLRLVMEGLNWCFVGLESSRSLRSTLGLSLHLDKLVSGKQDPQCHRLLSLCFTSLFCVPHPVVPTTSGHSCILRANSVLSSVYPALKPSSAVFLCRQGLGYSGC